MTLLLLPVSCCAGGAADFAGLSGLLAIGTTDVDPAVENRPIAGPVLLPPELRDRAVASASRRVDWVPLVVFKSLCTMAGGALGAGTIGDGSRLLLAGMMGMGTGVTTLVLLAASCCAGGTTEKVIARLPDLLVVGLIEADPVEES